jgi:hypothetical protein
MKRFEVAYLSSQTISGESDSLSVTEVSANSWEEVTSEFVSEKLCETVRVHDVEELIQYINVYSCAQNWGGPEGGGWWWESRSPIASIPVIDTDDAAIEAEKARWAKWAEDTGYIPWEEARVARRSGYTVVVEDYPARYYPQEEVPHPK